jgi:hypothetical protein
MNLTRNELEEIYSLLDFQKTPWKYTEEEVEQPLDQEFTMESEEDLQEDEFKLIHPNEILRTPPKLWLVPLIRD